jgi:hypothetical protein
MLGVERKPICLPVCPADFQPCAQLFLEKAKLFLPVLAVLASLAFCIYFYSELACGNPALAFYFQHGKFNQEEELSHSYGLRLIPIAIHVFFCSAASFAIISSSEYGCRPLVAWRVLEYKGVQGGGTESGRHVEMIARGEQQETKEEEEEEDGDQVLNPITGDPLSFADQIEMVARRDQQETKEEEEEEDGDQVLNPITDDPLSFADQTGPEGVFANTGPDGMCAVATTVTDSGGSVAVSVDSNEPATPAETTVTAPVTNNDDSSATTTDDAADGTSTDTIENTDGSTAGGEGAAGDDGSNTGTASSGVSIDDTGANGAAADVAAETGSGSSAGSTDAPSDVAPIDAAPIDYTAASGDGDGSDGGIAEAFGDVGNSADEGIAAAPIEYVTGTLGDATGAGSGSGSGGGVSTTSGAAAAASDAGFDDVVQSTSIIGFAHPSAQPGGISRKVNDKMMLRAKYEAQRIFQDGWIAKRTLFVVPFAIYVVLFVLFVTSMQVRIDKRLYSCVLTL